MNTQKYGEADYLSTKYANIASDIYHYTSSDGLIGILKNKELWLTNIYFLNDNQEFFYTYRLIKEVLADIEDEINKNFLKRIKSHLGYRLDEDYFKKEAEIWFRKEYYIASFSLDSDNLSLWNYYTKSENTGYNLCFKGYMFHKHAFVQGKVCYKRIEQKNMLKDTILKFNVKYTNAKSNEKINIIFDLFHNFIIYGLFFKASKYEVENEYRIIMTMHNSTNEEKENCCYREKNGLIIPFIKFNLENLRNNVYNFEHIINKIKISPLNKGEITKYGVTRLANGAGLHNCNITFSEASLRY